MKSTQEHPRAPDAVDAHAPGRHWLGELHGAPAQRLYDLDGTLEVFRATLLEAGFTILGTQSHAFPGGGFTAVFLLSESHASIHTWPERGYAAVDLFTCGTRDAAPVLDAVAVHLGAAEVRIDAHQRGVSPRSH